ncbi:MAG: LptF/LptG family permease [Candidatus Eisenbacteria bacterium]
MILHRYILTSLTRPFFIGFGFITFLLTMEMWLDLLDMLLGRGVGISAVSQLFLLALGWMVALSVPCGVLVAVLMTYGRMSQDNEITALRASGVHLRQIVAPSLVASVILAAALAAFNNYILPETNYRYASLLYEINRKNPTVQIREGVINDAFQGYAIRINQLDDRTGAMQDILILDAKADPRNPRTVLAKSGTLSFRPDLGLLVLDLQDGTMHEADPESKDGDYRVVAFEHQRLQIEESAESLDGRNRRRSDRELSISAMQGEIDKLEADIVRERERMDDALSQLEMTEEELALVQPGVVPQGPWEQWTRGVVGLFEKVTPPEKPDWTREQENAIGVVRARLREIQGLEKRVQKYSVEIHKKVSIPVACVVFVLVGAPLGILSRRGGLAAGILSAVFFVFYYLCLIGGEQLADRLVLPTWLAMWFPNLLLGAIGLLFMRRAIASGPILLRNKGGSRP